MPLWLGRIFTVVLALLRRDGGRQQGYHSSRTSPRVRGSFGGQALITPALFDKKGAWVSARSFVNTADLALKIDVFNASAPIYITTYFALLYMSSFIVFAAYLVARRPLLRQRRLTPFSTAMRDLDNTDTYAKMKDVYFEVPDLFIPAALVEVLGFMLALVSMVQSYDSGRRQQIGLNDVSEFLIGLILPWRIAAVMAFKDFFVYGRI
ncbi:hypothetical protein DFJ73DRAFT_780992 [Zopfochytrium polystomum]|nr:hypothetical protein DFJ73DRAFT_780992 [Zopfochytrium polystomum]